MIIILNSEGTFFNIKETAYFSPEIDYTYTIQNIKSVVSVPVASDLNKDGEVEIIFIYSSQISGENINILANYNACWLADVDNNEKFEFVYSNFDDLYIVNVPDAGSDIGWPGQRANVRNTGVYEQPAYFGDNGETVYWMNTIILSPDVENIIPGGSTVIIKPGTKIKAHANSELIVQGTLIAEGTEKFPITFMADINGAQEGYWQGIAVPNHGILSMKYCEIKDAEIGVLFQDYNDVTFNNCLLENNLEGIGAFNSNPVIKENIITENNTGIGCYNNSAPILTDFHYEIPFKNGIINNNTGILLSQSIVYLDNGYNDIYNFFSGGYFINIISEPAKYIKARYNYWGTTDLNEIYENLNPPQLFYIEPILTPPQSSYAYGGGDESEMLKSATTSMESGDYSAAEYTYKAIIQQYPDAQEAYVSVSGLYDCIKKSNGNWDYLESYYNELYNDSIYSSEFVKLVFGYVNLSKREQGKFDEAIFNYESIIQNNPTYNDSVFAVIDIGNTYEEAGNYKSTLGQLSELVPVSRAKHVEKTVDLLLSLKIEGVDQNINGDNKFFISDVYPNPFTDETAISYFIPFNSKISFNVFDATGKMVLSQAHEGIGKGNHKLILKLPEVSPGLYYIILRAEGNNMSIKKIVVK